MRLVARGVFGLAFGALVIGCSDPASPRPTPLTPSEGSLPVTTLKLVSGWDGSPVVGARASVGSGTFYSDGSGTVAITGGGWDVPLDIVADGYLRRHTLIAGDTVSLWPAAGPAEEEAIRELAFVERGEAWHLRDSFVTMHLVIDRSIPSGVAARIPQAAREINALLGRERIGVAGGPTLAEEAQFTVLVAADRTGTCRAWLHGVCYAAQFAYGSDETLLLAADALARLETPLRGLASAFLRGDNPLPGLLSRRHPTASLSLLEQQALRMLGQRSPCTIWPDDDREPC